MLAPMTRVTMLRVAHLRGRLCLAIAGMLLVVAAGSGTLRERTGLLVVIIPFSVVAGWTAHRERPDRLAGNAVKVDRPAR